jgi:restriction system protein
VRIAHWPFPTIPRKYRSNKTYSTYKSYFEPPAGPEIAANALACLIHQANYLLDQQLRSLERDFLKTGGFTERLYQARLKHRQQQDPR